MNDTETPTNQRSPTQRTATTTQTQGVVVLVFTPKEPKPQEIETR